MVKVLAIGIIKESSRSQSTTVNMEKRPSDVWWARFEARHPELTSRTADSLDRVHAATPKAIEGFFKLYEALYVKHLSSKTFTPLLSQPKTSRLASFLVQGYCGHNPVLPSTDGSDATPSITPVTPLAIPLPARVITSDQYLNLLVEKESEEKEKVEKKRKHKEEMAKKKEEKRQAQEAKKQLL
ncbi:hypothetical protein DPX16_0893 [Anabarilius grahami]|uniref:Uncharacterized protein n=1 Tax=Anabarilius grahami TaxID=495550 RepID=A0A3N0XTK5_ANAGA|nr:hypothetical protein DPX16_0893 [Anabarilius grahami]